MTPDRLQREGPIIRAEGLALGPAGSRRRPRR